MEGSSANSAQPTPVPAGRRWLQFRLRTLLILVALLGLGCAYVRLQLARYEAEWHEEDTAIARISAMLQHSVGGEITVGRASHGPAWLKALVPSDRQWIFDRVESVGLEMNFATDRDETGQLIEELKKFRFLQDVAGNGNWHGPEHARVDFEAIGSALHISIPARLQLVAP
jgi:hypothetical protein